MNPGEDDGEEKNTLSYQNTLYIHLEGFNSAAVEGNFQPWMQLRLFPDHMEFLRYGAAEPYKMDYPESLRVLTAFVEGKRLLLIGKTNLWEINLEHASASAPVQ